MEKKWTLVLYMALQGIMSLKTSFINLNLKACKQLAAMELQFSQSLGFSV